MKNFITFLLLFCCLNTLNLSFANRSNAESLENIETNDLVKAGKKYITLVGKQREVGDKAPNFKVVDKQFMPVELTSFKNKPILISVVPSLDTGVCSLQTKRFNEEVANLPKDVVMLTISNDLPFAQKRFCAAEGVDKLKVLSDSVWRDFGYKYGLLIKDMGLLARAIFVIDSEGKIAYKELVSNLSQHPNYDMALSAIKSISQEPITESATAQEQAQAPAVQ